MLTKKGRLLFKNRGVVSGAIKIEHTEGTTEYYNVYYNGEYKGLVFPGTINNPRYRFIDGGRQTYLLPVYRYVTAGETIEVRHLHDLFGRINKMYRGR